MFAGFGLDSATAARRRQEFDRSAVAQLPTGLVTEHVNA